MLFVYVCIQQSVSFPVALYSLSFNLGLFVVLQYYIIILNQLV